MTAVDPLGIIGSADIGDNGSALQSAATSTLDLDQLPAGVVSGTALIGFSATPDVTIRSSVSLSTLFANRAATSGMKAGGDEDDWLALYTQKLSMLSFRVGGMTVTRSTSKKLGMAMIALGMAGAVAPLTPRSCLGLMTGTPAPRRGFNGAIAHRRAGRDRPSGCGRRLLRGHASRQLPSRRDPRGRGGDCPRSDRIRHPAWRSLAVIDQTRPRWQP